MFTILKLIRNLIKAITGASAPWQVGLGSLLGCLLGFLPLWPGWPSPLAWALLLAALLINVHLGSFFLFWGLGTLLGLALAPVALALGNGLEGLAQLAATCGPARLSRLNHTGHLGLFLLGLPIATLVGLGTAWATRWFDRNLRARLAERSKLMKAGKLAGNTLVLRGVCWFLGV